MVSGDELLPEHPYATTV